MKLLVSELVWYLANEVGEVNKVKKLTQSINYIHEAYRNYVKLSKSTGPHRIKCVNIFINLV